jgi:hypothetical protein
MHTTKSKKKKPPRSLLKDVAITEVSFVGRGANEGARQSLFKTADTDDMLKRLFSEVMSDMKASEAAQRLLGDMCEAIGYLRHSLVEIMEDPRVEQRKDMLRQSVQEFSSALATMIDNAELTKEFKGVEKTQFLEEDFAYIVDDSTRMLRLTATPGGAPEKHFVDLAMAALEKRFGDLLIDIPAEAQVEVAKRIEDAWRKLNPGNDEIPEILTTIQKEETMSKEAIEKLEAEKKELEAQVAKANFLASLTDVQKEHYNGLSEEDQEAFEKLDATARQEAVDKAIATAAAKDESFEMEGQTIKKSEVGEGVFAVLKAQQTRLEKAEADAKAEKDARLKKELEDEAEKMFPHLEGTPAEKGEMLKGIRALPKDQQEKQIKMLKAADAAMEKSFKELGQGGTGDENTPTEKLNKLAKTRAEEKGITVAKAYAQVLETEEGAALYAETVKPQ